MKNKTFTIFLQNGKILIVHGIDYINALINAGISFLNVQRHRQGKKVNLYYFSQEKHCWVK